MIEAFDDQHPRLTASQAGTRCGLTRTAARRYLLTLAHLGYVGSDGKLSCHDGQNRFEPN